ncbi:hypothetical protein [Pelagibaculum spongiae]|uniref:Uncharacterized protein n=1 Tax=Pelagibaculum spongiae TaxID=2080658 RepID=A0A2V1GVE8_9GAMM|nr:hypothetical protein [Pelagibaculum spongiae]PVZ70308.1 hypothetical protein DC094_06850 [Pelagibaculum spongiae]
MRLLAFCLLFFGLLVKPVFAGDYLGYTRTASGDLPLPQNITYLAPQLQLNLRWGRHEGWKQPIEVMPVKFIDASQKNTVTPVTQQNINQQLNFSLTRSQRLNTRQKKIARWQLFTEIVYDPAVKKTWFCSSFNCQNNNYQNINKKQPAELIARFKLIEKNSDSHSMVSSNEMLFEKQYRIGRHDGLQLLINSDPEQYQWLHSARGLQYQLLFNRMSWDLLQAMAPVGDYIPVYMVKNDTIYLDVAPKRYQTGQMLTALHQPSDIGLDSQVVNTGPLRSIGYVQVIASGREIIAEPLDFRADMMRPGDLVMDPGPWLKPLFARAGVMQPSNRLPKAQMKFRPKAVTGDIQLLSFNQPTPAERWLTQSSRK